MVKLSAQVGAGEKEVTVEPLDDGRWRVVIGGTERIFDARRLGPNGTWSILVDGRVYTVDLEPGKDGDVVAEVGGNQAVVKLLDARRKLLAQASALKGRAATAGPLAVRAPMPGKVVKVLVKQGEQVTAGQGVAVVEAMKMENELRAPRDGAVTQVHVTEGQAVEAQEPLVTLA